MLICTECVNSIDILNKDATNGAACSSSTSDNRRGTEILLCNDYGSGHGHSTFSYHKQPILRFQRDLQLCVTLALKASYGFPLTTSGFRFRAHTRPEWWPDDLEWSIRYIDAIFPVQVRYIFIIQEVRLSFSGSQQVHSRSATSVLSTLPPGRNIVPFWCQSRRTSSLEYCTWFKRMGAHQLGQRCRAVAIRVSISGDR